MGAVARSARCPSAPSRPVLWYHGGKFRLAPWIVAHLPPSRCRVEAYAGAASVTLAAAPAPIEVINDLDDRIVTVFEVLRDPVLAAALAERIRLTPFSRTEFETARQPATDPVEIARRTIYRSFGGFGAGSANPDFRTGFGGRAATQRRHPARSWAAYPDAVDAFTRRLQGVVIECRPAVDVIAAYDQPDAVHYLDPPYLPTTRRPGKARGVYRREMTEADHRALLDVLTDRTLRGMVVLSGYGSDLYSDALAGWRTVERTARAHGGGARVERLWLNPAAAQALADTRRLQGCRITGDLLAGARPADGMARHG